MAPKRIRCLYCEEPYEFLAGVHLKTHFGDRKNSFKAYKDWVAETHGLPRDHAVFQTPGALTRPETHQEYRHLFDGRRQ